MAIALLMITGCVDATPPAAGSDPPDAGGCVPRCEVGETSCEAGEVTRCVDTGGCRHFADPLPCPSGTACDRGVCVGARGGCIPGERVCAGDGYVACVSTEPGDEWSEVMVCAEGTSCSGGGCLGVCFDECAPGSVRCVGAATETCGESTDGDPCSEWTDYALCPDGTTCSLGTCGTECADECAFGDTLCSGDGFVSCGQYDSDDCLELGPVNPCGAGETCSFGACAAVCTDECASGAAGCAPAGGVKLCGNYDADTCLEWSSVVACPVGKTCMDGACVATCTDECAPVGASVCSGAAGTKTCGNYDGDECLEWSGTMVCPVGKTCVSGVCVTTCSDECAPVGTTACSGTSAVKSCGNYDGDECLEWSADAGCGAGKVCSSGVCVTACTDECAPTGTTACSGGSAVKSCGNYDGDSCLEWSAPVGCGAGKVCSSGVCVASCTDGCSPAGTTTCVDSATYATCGNYDGDSCLEWSGGMSCGAYETCSGGSCISGLPDLKFYGTAGFVFYDAGSSEIGGSILVENQGVVKSPPYTVGIYFDLPAEPTCATLRTHTEYATDFLDADYTTGWSWRTSYYGPRPVKAYLFVDATCEIAESNESNNIISLIVE